MMIQDAAAPNPAPDDDATASAQAWLASHRMADPSVDYQIVRDDLSTTMWGLPIHHAAFEGELEVCRWLSTHHG